MQGLIYVPGQEELVSLELPSSLGPGPLEKSSSLCQLWGEETPGGSTATMPGPANRRGTLQEQSRAVKELWSSTAPSPVSGRLDSILPPEQKGGGRESEIDDLRNSSSLKSKPRASHVSSLTPFNSQHTHLKQEHIHENYTKSKPKSCGEATGLGALTVVVARRRLKLSVRSSRIGAAVNFDSRVGG